MRFKRLLNIWLHGKLPACKRMAAFQDGRRWYFAFNGRYPETMNQVNDLFKMRAAQIQHEERMNDPEKLFKYIEKGR
jgi:hypothetical protein